MNLKEKRWIKKAKSGDKEALLNLIINRKDEYYGLSFSYMKNEQDAMDCLQDMIVKLYKNIDRLRQDNRFYSWSKTILVNICKDLLAENKRNTTIKYMAIEEESEEFRQDDNILIDELLEDLEIIYSEIIRLRYFLGYDYKSISKILDIPIGTVKSRLHYGIKLLEEKLKEDGEYNVR